MRPVTCSARRAALILLMAMLFPLPVRAVDAPRRVMLVFDGSGSMWGKIEGEKSSKLAAARDALRRALPALGPDTVTGLTSFGHRRRGDCGDVETIIDIGPLDTEALMLQVDKLNPKGKGPLALAVREAAKALGPGLRSSIVLIHDGADNCQQDACAAAAEIAKTQPGLTIHTVGLGLEPEDAVKSACIAAATGGRTFDARDNAQIESMVGEAMKLAGLDAATPRDTTAGAEDVTRQRPPTMSAVQAAAKAVEQPALTAPGLDVSVTLGVGGAPITAPIRWRVARADTSSQTILQVEAARLSRPLASGRYVVEARQGLAVARQTIDVGDGPATPVQLALDAGIVTPAARAFKDGDILSGVTYSIRAVTRPSGAASSGALWIGRSGGSDIVLPVGSYIVRAEIGLVRKEETVTLAAGSRTTVDLLLGTGRLGLTATLSDDGPPVTDVTFIVSEDDPDSPQGRREVTRSAAPQPEFVLSAGTYYVTARVSGAEARQRVAVGAGDIVKQGISLDVSRLTVVGQIGTPSGQSPPTILTRVTRLEGDRAEVARSAAAGPEFLLPPGRYQVAMQAGLQNVKAERIVEIKASETAKLTIPIEAAHVVLKVRDAASLDQFWEVRDAGGQVVWRTTQSDARMTLTPGRYVAQVEWRGRRLEKAFDVSGGEQKVVVLGTD